MAKSILVRGFINEAFSCIAFIRTGMGHSSPESVTEQICMINNSAVGRRQAKVQKGLRSRNTIPLNIELPHDQLCKHWNPHRL